MRRGPAATRVDAGLAGNLTMIAAAKDRESAEMQGFLVGPPGPNAARTAVLPHAPPAKTV